MRRRALLATLAVPLPLRANPARDAVTLDMLLVGGMNVYLRHAITDRTQSDGGRLGDRANQRNLSAAGIAQAQALGAAWRRRNLPLGEVLASPVFRALDTAQLAFGEPAVRTAPFLTADDYTPDAALLARNIAETRARLNRPPEMGNDVFVGHIVPLGMILGRSLSQAEFPEGCLAIFRPGGGLVGFLPAETLINP